MHTVLGKSGILTTLMAAGLALIAVGCIAQPAQAPVVEQPGPQPDDGEPFLGGGEGDDCVSTASCEAGLRCLRQGGAQFCVQVCFDASNCRSGQCNPVQGSEQGWCTPQSGGPGPDDDPAPDPGDDPAPDPGNDPAPEPNPEPEPEPEPIPQAFSEPGERCDCDSDCAAVDGHGGICIRGICMLEASGTCAGSGSRNECPTGARCWRGTGLSICYPDCGGFPSCDGTCDSDNSCVSDGGDCYQSCGTMCNRTGTPPGQQPDPEPDPGPGPGPIDEGNCGSTIESEEFALTNQARVSSGLPALQCDLALADVARAHSEDMARRNFFSHTNPEGEQPWDRMRRQGIADFSTAGENIAYGYSSPSEVHSVWMNSSGHRANILSRNYTHIGVGAYNDNGTLYWTQVFAAY